MLFSIHIFERWPDGAIDSMMNTSYARSVAVASTVLGCSAMWRAGLAVCHYRASLNITDDPSIRELEVVSALFELGLATVLLGHAMVAAYLIRRPIQIDSVTVGAVAALAGVVVAGSFLQVPLLGIPGVLPASLILGCALAGFYRLAPWASSYLGALLGSSVGFYFGAPDFESIALLAVIVPPALFALMGVTVGRLLHRLESFQRNAR